jgi:hypothetical protein
VQAVGDTTGVSGRVVSNTTTFTVDTSAPLQTTAITSVTDNVSTNGSVGNTTTAATIVNGASTDDTTPTLNGTISAALTGAQVVGVYDTVAGVKTKLGNATVSGTTWSYTPGGLNAGAHNLIAVVDDPTTGTSSTASSAYVVDIHSGLTTSLNDFVGAAQGVIAQSYGDLLQTLTSGFGDLVKMAAPLPALQQANTALIQSCIISAKWEQAMRAKDLPQVDKKKAELLVSDLNSKYKD